MKTDRTRQGRGFGGRVLSVVAIAAAATTSLVPPGAWAQDAPAAGAAAAPAGRASLAVIPFSAPPEVERMSAADLELLYDALVRLFVKANKFDVLERTRIQSVVDENRFATSTLGDPANAVQFGKLTGAQYLVVGSIRELSVTETRREIDYVKEIACTQSAKLRIELRVVQTQTGRIVGAHSAGDGRKGPVKSAPCGSRQGLLDDAMNAVAADLVAKVVDAVYPMKVVAATGEEVTLNRGEGAPFKVGARLNCVATGAPIVDPDTGETLGSDEFPVGSVVVTDIQPKMSRARPENGAGIPVGAICRVAPPAPASRPAKREAAPKVDF